MSETTYHQINKDILLNRPQLYYKNDKERLRDNARDKYRNLFEEEKNKQRQILEKIDMIIYIKKRNKNYKTIKKIIVNLTKVKSLQKTKI